MRAARFIVQTHFFLLLLFILLFIYFLFCLKSIRKWCTSCHTMDSHYRRSCRLPSPQTSYSTRLRLTHFVGRSSAPTTTDVDYLFRLIPKRAHTEMETNKRANSYILFFFTLNFYRDLFCFDLVPTYCLPHYADDDTDTQW